VCVAAMKATARFVSVVLIAIAMSSSNVSINAETRSPSKYFLYVGVYGKGVYAYRFDSQNGVKLESIGLAGEVTNPSFITSDPSHRFLYAVSELEGKADGGVSAFAIDRKSGSLRFLNKASSAGVAPCHLSVDHSGKMLAVANYGTGGVSIFPIQQDGHLGAMSDLLTAEGKSINQKRQEGPHAHEAVITSNNRFLYVPDLGLDRIRIYRIHPEDAKAVPNEPAFTQTQPGSGPRHIAFSADGKYAYVVHELEAFVTVFQHNPETGELHPIQKVSTVPPDFKGEAAPAEIAIDPSGRFVYASNRGPGTIAAFAVNANDGTLQQTQVVPTGDTFPRAFEFDPSGNFMFVGDQKANHFVIFAVDKQTGHLTLTGQKFDVPSPVSFLFVRAE